MWISYDYNYSKRAPERKWERERVSVSAVMSAFYRLAPKITIIEKIQSGGMNQKWIEGSYNVTKQMQIMLGRITDKECMTDRQGKSNALTKEIKHYSDRTLILSHATNAYTT